MFYYLIFAGIAVLLVVAYFVQQSRQRGGADSPEPAGHRRCVPHPQGQLRAEGAQASARAVEPRPAQAPLTLDHLASGAGVPLRDPAYGVRQVR